MGCLHIVTITFPPASAIMKAVIFICTTLSISYLYIRRRKQIKALSVSNSHEVATDTSPHAPYFNVSPQQVETIMTSLERKITSTIPLTNPDHIDISLDSFDSITMSLTVSAPLRPNNVNIHGSAFAGSIHATCSICAWALVNIMLNLSLHSTYGHNTDTKDHNRCCNKHIDSLSEADIKVVLKSTTIAYKKPVIDEHISCISRPVILSTWEAAIHDLYERKRCSFPVFVDILGSNGLVIVEFTGVVVAFQ